MSLNNNYIQNQRRRDNVERVYINTAFNNNDDGSINHFSNYDYHSNSSRGFIPPISNRKRPFSKSTYITPQLDESPYYQPNYTTQYETQHFTRNNISSPNRHHNQTAYIEPIPIDQYEKNKRKRYERSNITIESQKEKQSASCFSRFLDILDFIFPCNSSSTNTSNNSEQSNQNISSSSSNQLFQSNNRNQNYHSRYSYYYS